MLRIKDHHRKPELKNFWKTMKYPEFLIYFTKIECADSETEKHVGELALCNIRKNLFYAENTYKAAQVKSKVYKLSNATSD